MNELTQAHSQIESVIQGRPTDYKVSYNKLAYQFSLLGATDKEMASFFNVSVEALNLWKHKHPNFIKSLKAGKEHADSRVAKSLFHRALGYSHEAVKIFQIDGATVEHKYIEHYPPDTAAASLWLKNRQPDKWREVQRLEVTGKDGGPIEIETATVEQLEAELMRQGKLIQIN